MAAPRRVKTAPSTRLIAMRVTEEEYDEIHSAAIQRGIPMSDVLRMAVAILLEDER